MKSIGLGICEAKGEEQNMVLTYLMRGGNDEFGL
jgi:hypothetical protein